MSRPLDAFLRRFRQERFLCLLASMLISTGAGLPLISLMGFEHQLRLYGLAVLGVHALILLWFTLQTLPRRIAVLRFVPPLAFVAFEVFEGLQGRGLYPLLISAARAAALLLQGDGGMALVYAVPLTCLFAVFISVLSMLLVSAESFFLPCLLVGLSAAVAWLTGVHEGLLFLLPALPGLMLAASCSHPNERATLRGLARLLPAAVLLLLCAVLIAPPEGTKNDALSDKADEVIKKL